MRRLEAQERLALFDVARALSVKPLLPAALIEFESRWNPQARNLAGGSACGLIQFIDDTAFGMGFSGPDFTNPRRGAAAALIAAFPDTVSQLRGPVLDYLRPMAPFRDVSPALEGQSLFLAVFYPRARRWEPDRSISEDVRIRRGEARAETYKRQNPGIDTPRDYVEHVWRRAGTVEIES